jgi:non-ribosomal peptide synthetase component F
LTDLYAAAVGASPEIGPPPARYTDLMRRQRQRLTGTTYDAQAAYWRDRFTPPPPVLELPGDHPRPTIQTFDGGIEAFVLPSALAGALHRLGREQGVTLFMILLAALDVLLHRYTGLDDIAVGTPIANRTDVEAEKVVGLFANTLVLRADLSGDPTVRELLRRVRDVALGAYAAQEFPFERLVEMVQPVRDMSHSPLFQVMLILQNAPFEAIELAGLTLSYLEIRTGSAKTDLTLEVWEKPEGLQVFVEYNTDLFEAETVRRLGEHLQRVLTAFAADPEQRVSRVPLLGETEWRRVTVEWNDTATPLAEGPVTRLLEAEAVRAPEAIAASQGMRRVTTTNSWRSSAAASAVRAGGSSCWS